MNNADAAAPSDEHCQALLSSATLYLGARCTKTARHTLAGLELCGTHLRIAERWQAEGRLAARAKYWWGLEVVIPDPIASSTACPVVEQAPDEQ
jgi:hypothetical protein